MDHRLTFFPFINYLFYSEPSVKKLFTKKQVVKPLKMLVLTTHLFRTNESFHADRFAACELVVISIKERAYEAN